MTDLVRVSSRFLETGLLGFDAALRAVDRWVGAAAGRGERELPTAAPAAGPADLDAATSDLANRLLRLLLSRWRHGTGIVEAPRDVAEAVRRSWPGDGLDGARRWLALPFELPLSLATLATQEGLRAVAALAAVRPELWVDFLDYVAEVFSDLSVYFSLQYGEELARQQRLVADRPDHGEARLELARTYMKCGLFREALDELDRLASDRGLRRQVHYLSTVASYRMGDYEGACCHGEGAMAAGGGERARYWLWLASEKRGGYPESVRRAWRMEARDGQYPTGLELEEVAREIGLDKTSGGRGTAVFDATGDGTLDVVVAGAHAGLSLYLNNGDGTFRDASVGSGLDRVVYAFAVAAGDYDNDGRVDLFVTGLGFYDGQGLLLRNNGDGTFTDVTKEAGLGCWGPGFTAIWVDYDGDGFLDLFVVNNLGGLFDRKTPNRLFRNNGDGTFTDVTRASGLATPWPSLGACWGDFWNDGRPDLFVSNLGHSQLFRNQGDGTFRDVSCRAGVGRPGICSGAIACDVDDDGWLDVVQFTYSRPQDAIYTLRHGKAAPGAQTPRVWRNNRDGTFTDVGRELGLTGSWGTMSAAAGDVDNDGRQDLLLGNGDPSIDRLEAAVLYQHDGRRFRNVTFAAGMPATGKGHGANMADLAGDGRLHLIVGAGGLYPGDLMTTTVHRPKTRPGNYLNVRLVGTESNRDAVGARLALHAGGRVQHRLVSGGSGFGCLPYEQHFGLGAATAARWLEIRWPSGRRQRVASPPVNDTVRVVEGEDGWTTVYGVRAGTT